MKRNDLRLRLIPPLRFILNVSAVFYLIIIPFMLWDLFVLGLPSEGGLSMNPLREGIPTSFELVVMASALVATSLATLWHSIEPVWDNYVKEVLDSIGRFLLIYQAYKWIKNKWLKKKKRA